MMAQRLRRTYELFQDAVFEKLEVRLARQVLYLAAREGRVTPQGTRLGTPFPASRSGRSPWCDNAQYHLDPERVACRRPCHLRHGTGAFDGEGYRRPAVDRRSGSPTVAAFTPEGTSRNVAKHLRYAAEYRSSFCIPANAQPAADHRHRPSCQTDPWPRDAGLRWVDATTARRSLTVPQRHRVKTDALVRSPSGIGCQSARQTRFRWPIPARAVSALPAPRCVKRFRSPNLGKA